MSKMIVRKFTPGPWTFSYDKYDKWVDLGLEGSGVCRVNNDDIDDDEAQANARLIAAAPDLYAACKMCAEWLESNRIAATSSYGADALKLALSALAKAEGGIS